MKQLRLPLTSSALHSDIPHAMKEPIYAAMVACVEAGKAKPFQIARAILKVPGATQAMADSALRIYGL